MVHMHLYDGIKAGCYDKNLNGAVRMEYMIFAVVMAGLVLTFLLKGYYDFRKSEKQFAQSLYTDYGILPQREYSPVQFENISHYFLKHTDGFHIDDIT